MPFVSECERRGGGSGSSSGSSLSARRGSDSRAGVLQWDEVEEIDGEVQSSYRGPFDTMDALQDALPNKRKGASKFYNGKTNSVADAAQPAKGTADPVNPSPKKRKGFLSFGFSWTKSWSRRGATSSSENFGKTLSAALTGSAQGNSRGGGNEHQGCQDPAAHCLHLHRRSNMPGVSASPPGPGALRPQLISVQMQSVSVAGVEDVAESTASVSPREKRRRSLQ